MSQLTSEMQKMGFSGVTTLLNSGNVIFTAEYAKPKDLGTGIASHLQEVFGFEIPTQVIDAEDLRLHLSEDPFAREESHEKIRFYITFIPAGSQGPSDFQFRTEDGSFRVISRKGNMLCSVLDLNLAMTTDAMALLDKKYGEGITTRNWNTIQKILKKLDP